MGEVNLECFESDRMYAFFIDFCRPCIAMNDPKLPSQLEVTQRFFVRFADLMSNGSNAANLLQAAELLLAQTDRAELAEERLGLEQMRSAELEQRMVATKPVDFRKGKEGLAALVRESMGADPFSGAVYVFLGQASGPDQAGVLGWNGPVPVRQEA